MLSCVCDFLPSTKLALIDVLDRSSRNDCENLGLCSIADYLREQGIHVALFSINENDVFAAECYALYDYVGFSLYSNTAEHVYGCARKLKYFFPSVQIFTGGRLATHAHDLVFADCKSIDFIVLGYSEIPLARMIRYAKENPYYLDPNIAYLGKTTHHSEVNRSPFLGNHARDLLQIAIKRGNRTARLNTSLGCFGSCSFCSINSYQNTTRWVGKNEVEIVCEMNKIYHDYGIRSFVFNDASIEDSFDGSKTRLLNLTKLLIENEYKYSIRCSIRAESFCLDCANDVQLLREMKKAGFCNLFIGIESLVKSDLRAFSKRANREHNMSILKCLDDIGIDYTIGFIMINPYSTIDSVRENIAYLLEKRVHRPDVFLSKAEVYWDTALHHKLKTDALLCDSFNYKEPYQYSFKEDMLFDVERKLCVIRKNDSISALSTNILHLDYLLSELSTLYPYNTASFIDAQLCIRNRCRKLCQYLFSDLLSAKYETISARLSELESEINRIDEEIKMLFIRLIYDKTMRYYFTSTVDL